MDQLIRTNSCLLPFLAQPPGKEISYCNNYEHATKSLNIFQNVSSSCLISCLLVIPDLSLQLEDQYLINSLTRNFFANSGDRKGLFLLLPRDINFIESQNVYTPLTVLAEFLGIAGLFFGISVFGLADQLVRAIIGVAQKIGFQISCFRYLKTMFIAVVGLMSIALVLWVIVVFVSKYISIPVETKVSLVTGSPPMSMALCRSKYLTQYNYKIKEFFSVSEDVSFWQDGLDIREKIATFSVMNSAGDWILIWEASMPSIQDAIIFHKIIFPLDNQTVQFCEIHDLQQYTDLTKVRTQKCYFRFFHNYTFQFCPRFK